VGRVEPQPFLKWVGGKAQLLAQFDEFLPDRVDRYFEPFIGGGALFFALQRRRAVISDSNAELINCYQVIRDDVEGLIDALKQHQNQQDHYYAVRDWDRAPDFSARAAVERASRIIYLNKTCYNGLFRVNSQGQFNVPFGRYKAISYPADLSAYRPVLTAWSFTCTPFAQIELEPDDFVYADPLYDVQFTAYSSEPFGWQQQELLAQWLSRHHGPVILSNQATPRVIALYDSLGYDTSLRLQAPRMISCTGDRTRAEEVVATRNLPMPDLRFTADRSR